MPKTTVGIIGIRGFKVIYSGFETLVSNLVEKSDKKIFYFYLFSRSSYQKKPSLGINFKEIIFPVVNNKYLETPYYAVFSTIYSLFLPLNSVLYLSVANTPFLWLQRLRKRKIIVNVDGLDWKRARWSFMGKVYLKICERICVQFSDVIIADSKAVYKYYRKRYKDINVVHLTYGAEAKIRKTQTALKKYSMQKNKYFLFVGRLVPENKVEDLILAFKKLGTEYKCVIVGDSFFEEKYKQKLINIVGNDKKIIFTGILKGKAYEEILSHAFCYVETKEVGGVHPSLLEAMAFGNCVIAKNLPEHREVLSNCGLYYAKREDPAKGLEAKMTIILNNLGLAQSLGVKAKLQVKVGFEWKNVIDGYQQILNSTV